MTKPLSWNFLFRVQRDLGDRASAVETIRPRNKSSALFRASKSREMTAMEGTKSAPAAEIAAAGTTG
jgi:hypothetical protein